MNLLLSRLSGEVLGGAFEVSNALGSGFLEKVYENALAVELRRRGLLALQQAPVTVRYHAEIVGEYFADLLVENALIVELKAIRRLEPVHEAQCINYLKASRLPLCILLNFARPRLEYRRIVLNQNEPRMNADEHG